MALEILQVITDRNPRGAQVFAVDLHDALTQRGVAVRTVALARGTYDELLNVPSLGLSRLGPATLRGLRREVSRADVVVGHGSSTLAACAIIGPGTATHFVYRQISDLNFWVNSVPRYLRTMAFLRGTDAVVALYDGAADLLTGRFKVDPTRIRVIPNGVPAARFPLADRTTKLAARARFGLAPDRSTVVYVGALVPEKNPLGAIRAVSQLDGVQLLIVGDGPERPRVEQLAFSAGKGRVHVAGPVRDVNNAYAAADVVVLPSTGGESMPAVLIEAGLTGVPAVATDIGAVTDVVVHGRSGEIVPPGDDAALGNALRRVVERAHTFGAESRQRCLERFEIMVVAEAWERLLRDMVRAAP